MAVALDYLLRPLALSAWHLQDTIKNTGKDIYAASLITSGWVARHLLLCTSDSSFVCRGQYQQPGVVRPVGHPKVLRKY